MQKSAVDKAAPHSGDPLVPSPDNCGDCGALEAGTCLARRTARLSDYRPGDKGSIVQVCGDPEFRLRLMEMGFVKGTEVKVIKFAPLTDPIELVIKGYHLTLRKSEAADVLMTNPEQAA
ncbi:MAG: ferrous iron transport protein A [Desulfomonile sp.]|nr:ferrous iron transport protein A [Desulfomonile sp.]